MESKLFESTDYEVLLDSLKIRHMLSVLDIALEKRRHLNDFWASGDDMMFFYGKWNDRSDGDIFTAKIFALADYVTYIPYAEEGFSLLDGAFEKEGLSLAEWRYGAFLKIIGDVKGFPFEKAGLVKEFFLARKKPFVHFADITETTSLLLRALHCAENSGDPDYFLDDLVCDYIPANAGGDAAEMLKKFAPAVPPLSDGQKAFVLSTKERIESLL